MIKTIDQKNLIPVMRILKPGECRNCGNPVNVLVIESYILELDPAGYPIRHIPARLKAVGYCPTCGEFLNIEPKGLGFEVNSDAVKGYKTIKTYDPVDSNNNPFLKK